MCCECNQTEIRNGKEVTLQPGENFITFKKGGVDYAFRNANYTFVPFNIDGMEITLGEQLPDKIKITASNLCRINYIATSN